MSSIPAYMLILLIARKKYLNFTILRFSYERKNLTEYVLRLVICKNPKNTESYDREIRFSANISISFSALNFRCVSRGVL